ncbi:MAG: hypothetical protein HFG31_01965 [Eubacterium sp.]|nr:hypothetical protein [Eubacterium sp.]
MKKASLISIVVLFCIILMACSNKVESSNQMITTNENKNIECINSYGKQLYNYSAQNINEFKDWITDVKQKSNYNGAFKEVIDLYCSQYKKIYVPHIEGKQLIKIYVDSNQNIINYVYDAPAIRICIEPINTKENNKYNITDVQKFMEDKYQIKFGKKESIVCDDKNKTGYEYSEKLYEYQNIYIGGKSIKCVLCHLNSEKSKKQHIISFIKENMLIKIIYFDNNEGIELEGLEKLSFGKELLK